MRDGGATNSLDVRRGLCSKLSTALAYLDDGELRALVADGPSPSRGWGASGPATVGEEPVFIKRIPITKVERASMFSTRNHFGLPTFYSYGIGSAGFGAFREIAAHVKTTNWVLGGAEPNFPMLLHMRIMDASGTASPPIAELEGYRDYWAKNDNIATYMKARGDAPLEAWLVLEHIPHSLAAWLPEHPREVSRTIEDACTTISFLRGNGVVHFDAHTGNLLSDGERVYMADFGLLLDAGFDLADEERAFLDRHRHYDFGTAVATIATAPLTAAYLTMPAAKQEKIGEVLDLASAGNFNKMLCRAVENVERLVDDGLLAVDPGYLEGLLRWRPAVVYFLHFLGDLRTSEKKDTHFDDAHLARLLADSGLAIR